MADALLCPGSSQQQQQQQQQEQQQGRTASTVGGGGRSSGDEASRVGSGRPAEAEAGGDAGRTELLRKAINQQDDW
jgi:hypothetical protein